MSTTNTFIYRHFDMQHDFAPLVALLNEVEQADQDGEDVSEAALREQLTWSGHNPALDRWVVTLSGNTSLIGYGAIFTTPNDSSADFSIAVHRRWRRRGIGSELLRHLLTRTSETGVHDVRAYAMFSIKGQMLSYTNTASSL